MRSRTGLRSENNIHPARHALHSGCAWRPHRKPRTDPCFENRRVRPQRFSARSGCRVRLIRRDGREPNRHPQTERCLEALGHRTCRSPHEGCAGSKRAINDRKRRVKLHRDPHFELERRNCVSSNRDVNVTLNKKRRVCSRSDRAYRLHKSLSVLPAGESRESLPLTLHSSCLPRGRPSRCPEIWWRRRS